MYSPFFFRFSRKWRNHAYRLNNQTWGIWIGSIAASAVIVRHAVTAGSGTDTHRARMAADGSYKHRKYAEAGDNPLYRLPENPAGGHRADKLSPWQARAKNYEHH